MTPAINRWYFFLLVSLVLSGCSLPALSLPAQDEARLFKQGLDQYITAGDLTTLQRLPQEYPQGEWRSRAEVVISLAKQQTLQQKKVKALALCQQEKDALVQDNKMLETTLRQLKEVLIDTELKAK